MNRDTNPSQSSRSHQLYDRAKKVLPGGVSRNTVFRQPHPVYAAQGKGCVVTDIEHFERLDFSNNMASLIHGHAYPPIVSALTEQIALGTAFATATEAEVLFAEHLCNRISSVKKIRFVNSGTEAVMTALKAARAFTGKPKIAKAEGAYHGAYDYAEVSQTARPENWGDPLRPASVPVVEGTPKRALEDVVVLRFNDIDRTIDRLNQSADDIACVLIDPLPHRIGFIWANDDYISAIYDWTRQNNALLVFDEVITFRCFYGGAQERFSVKPDLTALGKMMGGGLPVGAIGGREDVMSVLDPTRPDLPFPHSGTFSANPATMTAGLTAMEHFDTKAVARINELGDYARNRIQESIDASAATACVTGASSFFRVHVKPEPPVDFRSCFCDAADNAKVKTLVNYLNDNGAIVINTCSGALSTPMQESDIDQFTKILQSALAQI